MFQLRSRSDDDWRELRDGVRGVRHFRFDGDRLPREAWLASGEHLEFAHDGEGVLRGIDADGRPFLRIDPAGGGVRFAKGDVVTELRIREDGRERSLTTRGERLRFEHDRQGRLARVFLPGSPTPLAYQWTGEACTIAPLGGPALLTVEPVEGAIRVTLAEPGGGWDETPPILGVQTITVRDRDGRELAACKLTEDALHRPNGRRWSDSASDLWQRDDKGRLLSWTRTRPGEPPVTRTYHYDDAGDLVSERAGRDTWLRETGEGHRVTALFRPDGPAVEYRYDAAGRRVARVEGGETTTYEYDVLGQLTRVTTPRGGDVRYTYDGLGRRVAVTTARGVTREHRDSGGRLWAVTDARGRALHTFVWFGGRMIARLDGDSDAPLAEAFLTDAGGTLIAVLAPRGNGLALERVDPPPFGAISSPLRPTLYGHTGDPETGLIHFGARELDPELGLFLTPDPWDGAPDDPRLWEGGDPAKLARYGEVPSATVHPYALCHFDPTGRTDLDGHYTDGWGILRTIFLAPTWGAPLTSVSLFFFLPFNIYFELIGDLIFLIAKICTGAIKAPWSNHHLWKLIGGAGSLRQGLLAFGLNGLLPRWVSSGLDISADRAVTVGHVIWINREELNVMDEPRVLEVWDLAGPPGPGGAPGGGAAAFNADPNKDSIVAVKGTKEGRSRVHAACWTRGFGNTVVPAGADQKFEDRPAGGGASAPGTLVLLTPLPDGFPHAREASDTDVAMEVQEYLFLHGAGRESTAELAATPAPFAIRIPTSHNAAVDNVLEIGAPKVTPVPDTVFAKVTELSHDRIPGLFWDDKVDTLFLDRELPANFLTGNGGNDLTVRRIVAATPAFVSAGWTQSGGPRVIEHAAAAADWPPALAKDDLFRLDGAAAADVAHARASRIEVKLDLAPTVTGEEPDAAGVVTLLRTDGAQFNAEVPDHTQFDKLHLTGDRPSLAAGDLLRVTRGAEEKLVRVTARNGDDLSIQPNVSSFTLNVNSATPVVAQKYVDTNADRDKGTTTNVAGDSVTLDCERAAIFHTGSYAAYRTGGARTFRKVNAVAAVKLHLTHAAAGAGPYTLTRMKVDDGLDANGIKAAEQARFLKKTGGGAAPSAFGTFPNAVLAVYPDPGGAGNPVEAVYFINPAAPGDLDPEYRKKWSARSVGGNDYWFFFEDLPIEEKDGTKSWRLDHDWTVRLQGGPPFRFKVREYTINAGARRADGGGKKVLAQPPEVQVPVMPKVHDTHRRALIEHELHHAVQNSKWGPLMNALPLTGIFGSIDVFNTAAGNPQEPWMRAWMQEAEDMENQGLGWAHLLSYGGWMLFIWKYFFLLPFWISEDARNSIQETKFDFWQKIFNPFAGFLTGLIPADPSKPAEERWGWAFLRLFMSAFDLRSWTPFTGFVPTLLPDGPRSFLEQQASRASGDLYSTILTADDKFNFHTHTFFVPDTHGADLTKKLGEPTRFQMFAGDRSDRVLAAAHGDRPGSPLRYLRGVELTTSRRGPVFRIEPGPGFTGATKALFHSGLYEVVGGGGATVSIEGPAPARSTVDFLRVDNTDDLQPRLRALVPTPPRVTRSTGFYFIPATPGEYDVTAYYINEILKRAQAAGAVFSPEIVKAFLGDKQFANTEHAKITVVSVVKLGERDVAWHEPVPVGGAINTLPLLDLFLTETRELHVEGHDNTRWKADITPDPSPGVDIAVNGTTGWMIRGASAFPANAADREVRVRLYRIFDPADPAFDLTYDAADTPTLQGKRSYLDAEIWVPVRDFRVEVHDLPAIPNENKTAAQSHEIEIPIALESAASITVTPPAGAPVLPHTRVGPASAAFPRGEKWRFGPPSGAIAGPTVYQINVRFGSGASVVNRPFTLTYTP